MREFKVNPHRFDPYKNFKFRVVWDGRPVAGVSRISGLSRVTDVIDHREGADPNATHKSPGLTRFEPIRLERGVTHDTAFEEWANQIHATGNPPGAEMALASFRKDIRIELLNEAGQVAIAYNVYRCWISEYQALPDLDASANGVALEVIVLQNEGWERDTSVVEPKEPE